MLAAVSSVVSEEGGVVTAFSDLNRPYDPVVILGNDLGNFVKESKNACICEMRVMAWRNGAWEVIPFQVDQRKKRTKVGGWKNYLVYKDEPEYVLNAGRHQSYEKPYFDDDDELVFMAKDAGDRVARAGWPSGITAGVEILLGANDNPGKAWAYVFSFDESFPPLSPRRYVEYDPDSDEVRTDSYIVKYTRREPLFFKALSIPETNGGSGANLVDREKFRTRVRLAGGFMDYYLDNLDFFGTCVGASAGPVRVIRRTRTKLEYFMFAGKYHYQELYYYADHFEHSLDMSHHSKLKEDIYDLTFRITTDLNPETAAGMRITSENNRGGATADGVLSDEEKKLNYGPTRWIAVDGAQGRWIQQMILPPTAGDRIWPDFYYLDDVKRLDAPEQYPGQFGNAGFRVRRLQHIAPGTQLFRMAYFFPKKIDDFSIVQATEVYGNPIEARINDQAINQTVPSVSISPDTRTGANAPEPSYVVHKEEAPTRGYFPQIMIDPNLGNGTGLGYVDRNLMHTGINVDSFFIISDRLFFVGHIILNKWSFLPKSEDMKIWIEYQDHPNRFFFGVGNDSPEDAETIYHWRQLLAFLAFTQTFHEKYGMRATIGLKNTEIGPGRWFSGTSKPTLQERFGFDNQITGGRLGPTPFGIEGGMSNYLQLALFHDGRDGWFNPHHGTYEEIRIDVVNPALGADFSFVRFGLEAKAFWAPKFLNRSEWRPNNSAVAKFFGAGKDRVFAARIAFDRIEAPQVNFNGQSVLDVPFFEQSYIGDSFNNRGYFWARYIDRDRAYLNVEYRAVMWKMWIIVLFYDTGRVFDNMLEANEWQNTSWNSYHHTVGFGLRGVFPAQLMMRMDVGFSAEHPGGIMYGNAYHTF